tara:strand:- start:208 stop:366 length:159 start_codon:yes stop_codon:yes gene_type:complete
MIERGFKIKVFFTGPLIKKLKLFKHQKVNFINPLALFAFSKTRLTQALNHLR